MSQKDLFFHQLCKTDTISICGAFMVPEIKKKTTLQTHVILLTYLTASVENSRTPPP